MTALSDACSRHPFSNGTEGESWMAVWCEYCVHDHGASHNHESCGDGCDLILNVLMPEFPSADFPWPEVWLPEPTGSFSLPSRLVCGQFQPCTTGDCAGDPQAATRAAITAEVTDYWRSGDVGQEVDQ